MCCNSLDEQMNLLSLFGNRALYLIAYYTIHGVCLRAELMASFVKSECALGVILHVVKSMCVNYGLLLNG